VKLKIPDSKGIHLMDLARSVWAVRLARQPSGYLLSKNYDGIIKLSMETQYHLQWSLQVP